PRQGRARARRRPEEREVDEEERLAVAPTRAEGEAGVIVEPVRSARQRRDRTAVGRHPHERALPADRDIEVAFHVECNPVRTEERGGLDEYVSRAGGPV